MTATDPRVAVFMGGPSAEHDVSMNSGAQVMAALAGQDPLPVVIGRDRSWTVGDERFATVGAAMDRVAERADVAFIALHGPFGEDGTVQGLLEAFRVPYTGSAVAASGLAMDKIRTKLLYGAKALPTPEFVVVTRPSLEAGDAWIDDVESRLGVPCVVKPAGNGSSFGVSFPKDRAELAEKVRGLVEAGGEILVERWVKGRELTCGVLEVAAERRVFALPVTEIIPGAKFAFFDYEAKYTPGATREVTPAEIPDGLTREIQRLALAAHLALGCRDFSRTDVMMDGERPLLLETNTIPGLTKTSLLPQAAAVVGIDFPALVRILVDNARSRRA